MARVKTASRIITNAGQRRTLVVVASEASIGPMPTESLVEYHCLLTLLSDPTVASVQVQPETFVLQVAGQTRRYTPDARVRFKNGVVAMREFKSSDTTLTADEEALLKAAGIHLRALGFEFQVVLSDEVRREPRLHNLRLLRRYSRWNCSDAVRRLAFAHLDSHRGVVLQDLRDLVGQAEYGAVLHLLWLREISADLDAAAIGPETSVWRDQP
jgi:hypothetical protein